MTLGFYLLVGYTRGIHLTVRGIAVCQESIHSTEITLSMDKTILRYPVILFEHVVEIIGQVTAFIIAVRDVRLQSIGGRVGIKLQRLQILHATVLGGNANSVMLNEVPIEIHHAGLQFAIRFTATPVTVVINGVGAVFAPVILVVVSDIIVDGASITAQFQAHVHLVAVTALQAVTGPEIYGFPTERHLALTQFQASVLGQIVTDPSLVHGKIVATVVVSGAGKGTGTDAGFRAEMPRTVTAVVIGIQNQRRIGEVAAGFVIEILAERGRIEIRIGYVLINPPNAGTQFRPSGGRDRCTYGGCREQAQCGLRKNRLSHYGLPSRSHHAA